MPTKFIKHTDGDTYVSISDLQQEIKHSINNTEKSENNLQFITLQIIASFLEAVSRDSKASTKND